MYYPMYKHEFLNIESFMSSFSPSNRPECLARTHWWHHFFLDEAALQIFRTSILYFSYYLITKTFRNDLFILNFGWKFFIFKYILCTYLLWNTSLHVTVLFKCPSRCRMRPQCARARHWTIRRGEGRHERFNIKEFMLIHGVIHVYLVFSMIFCT